MRSAIALTFAAFFIAAASNLFAQESDFQHAPPHIQMKQMQEGMQQKRGPGMMQRAPGMMQRGGDCPMMRSGMHGSGMMQGGMMMRKMFRFERFVISHAPEMKEELSLSSDKAKKLSEMQTEFKKRKIDRKANMQKMMIDLRNMKKDKASADELRNAMNKMHSMKTDMCLDLYETANKMLNELSEEQKQSLMDMMED